MAAQDAELKLKVSLDLGFFRQQLAGLGQAAAGYNMPINVKFDRQSITREINNLQRAIKRGTYRIEIGGNIDTLPDKIKTLKSRLASLESEKIDIGVGAVKSLSKRDAQSVKRELRQGILGEDKKIFVPVSITPSITNADVAEFKRAVKEKLSGISVKVKADVQGAGFAGSPQGAAGLMEYMRTQGMVGKTASSMEMRMRNEGQGFEQGLKSGFGEAARVGVQEIRSLFRALQSEAQSGTARLQAMIVGAMSGVVQLPGGGQQRGRLQQVGSNINAAMRGAVGRQAIVGQQTRAASTATPSFLSALPLMFGMGQSELSARLSGLYGQQYRAPRMGSGGLSQIGQIIQALSSGGGGVGAGGALSGQLFRGGAINPGVLSRGYIGRSALSAQYVNYPPGMPPAYPAGFAGAAAGSFRMGTGSLGQFPLAGPLQRGVGAGAGSFIPPGEISTAQRQLRSFGNALGEVKSTIQIAFRKVAGDFSLEDSRTQAQVSRAVTTQWAARGGTLGGSFVAPSGGIGTYRGGFPTSGMAIPSSPYGQINAQTSMFGPSGPVGPGNRPPGGIFGGYGGRRGGGGALGGAGGFANAMGNVRPPGTGTIREIGSEFANATKQVLLFGTAYKALAFVTSFPAQVGQAVGALQSFNNTLKAISPSAQEAKASNELILGLVERYNIPLQSARDGFTKLYASMQPTGFSGDEVRTIFTGISKAAAAFGMSADKVDRVNYAFAQMASKGQVMSEELKGQLGDVLPGAMAIFAEAAGFKGPDAIQEFSKALEDGAYKGQAMKVLLQNVGTIMNKEFGPGAEGAARTFQGAMNRIQNSMTRLYESFEPVAVGFLNSVVTPLTSGIKTITDGFNAFFTGSRAQTAQGFAFAQALESLRPAFEGIRANVTQLLPTLQGFGRILLEIGKVFLQIAANPFVGYMARVYLNVLMVTTAIQLLNLRALIPLIASFARSAYALIGFTVQCARAGQSAQVMGLMVRTAGITLRTFFATTGVGLVIVGISMLIEKFMSMNQTLEDTKNKALGAAQAIRAMSQTEARAAEQQAARDVKLLQQLSQQKSQGGVFGDKFFAPTTEQKAALERAGIGTKQIALKGGGVGPGIETFRLAGAIESRQAAMREAEYRQRQIQYQEKEMQLPAVLGAIAPSTGEQGGGAGGGAQNQQSLESYYSLQDQLAKNFTQDQINRMEQEFQARVNRINAEFDLREARANSFQKEAIKFEREITEIEMNRQKALLDASNKVLEAQGSVVAGTATAALSGIVARTGGALSQDPTTRGRSTGPHLHAQGAGMSEQKLRYLVDTYLDVGGKAASAYGQSRGSAGHGYNAIDFLTPQGTPIGLKGGASIRQYGPAGGRGGLMGEVITPEGSFQLGHLESLMRQGAGAARQVGGNERRDAIADQKTQLAIAEKSFTVQTANTQAVLDAQVAWEKYKNTAFPAAEQELQNKLLAKRNELFRSGLTDEMIDTEIKLYENQEKGQYGLEIISRLKEKGLITDEQSIEYTNELNDAIATQNRLLKDNAMAQRDAKFEQAMKGLSDQLATARALTPEQELRESIRQRGFFGAEAETLFQEEKAVQGAQSLKESLTAIASSIGGSFGNAFKGIITGASTAREALAGLFQSIADSFADMVAQMIAEWIKTQILQGFQSIFSVFTGGLGGGGSVLGGNSSAVFGLGGVDMNQYAPLLPMANGGVLSGGFQAFANGGIVTGPTLGLVGEGRYNEAIIPLPDGKSVPVDLGGAMGEQAVNNIVVNVDAKGSKVEGDAQEGKQLGRVIAAAIQQELVKQKRPGGLLA